MYIIIIINTRIRFVLGFVIQKSNSALGGRSGGEGGGS